MSNQTVVIGIDLGTTNSSIAVNIKGKIEMIKKPGGVEFTPSVFGYYKNGNKIVGQKAYDYLYKYNSKNEENNFKAEIKREMGTPEKIHFERPNINMTPEEISSEILKSLKEDVLRKYPDFQTRSVVITIPAAFSVLQSEATKRAGNLAGFEHVILLQEPIAAAVSYGFESTKDENWLIYDFGGGTFDVALISCKDGILSVLSHNGDNFLGGKNIDWDIVDKIIVPKILEKFSISGFTRENKKYQSVFSKLKYYAESSKIELSEYKKTTIEIDELGVDDDGKEISLSINILRSEMEHIIKPTIDKTIELSKETIKEAGIKETSVKKIVLVGGPTQIPYVQESLQSSLKIKVDSSVDPLTVVARGACIFAMSQKIPDKFLSNDIETFEGTSKISLNYVTLTSDDEESVTGIIGGLDEGGEYYIQIQSDSGAFTGSKTKLNEGKFFYTVNVEPNKQNIYWVYVFDNDGNPIKISTDSFSITHGLSVSGAPIPHSISVVVASRDYSLNQTINVCEKIFEKGSILPLKETLDVYKTSRKLRKGEDASLDVDIVEGESEIPDRNSYLCKLGIKGNDLPHDLPSGTPVELTVDMNESRELIVKAYIPLIDMTLNARYTIKDEIINVQEMSDDLELQRSRAESSLEDCSVGVRKKISEKLQSVTKGIKNSNNDEDEKRKTNKEIKDLKILLDKVEEEKEMPQLIKEYNERVKELNEIINEYADPKVKDKIIKQLQDIETEGKEAIKDEDKIFMIRINEQLDDLRNEAVFSNPSTWAHHFKEIVEGGGFINEKEAEYYTDKGIKAIEEGDVDELKRCVRQLSLLLPEEEKKKNPLSGISR
jgi:molecular chaperone DnaK